MNTTMHITVAAALTGLFAIQASAARADEDVSILAIQPLQAVNFDRGDEHIVGYYLSENGQCRLVLTRAAAPSPETPTTFTATRVEAVVAAGASTRYVSPDGNAFEFACTTDALALNVRTVERLASSEQH